MASSNDPRWPAPWARVALGTAVLGSIEREPRHGYAIAVELEARGFGRPRGGSLYPLLNSLEVDGAVQTTWQEGESGPGRRTYELTARGRERLDAERRAWSELVGALGPSSAGAISGGES